MNLEYVTSVHIPRNEGEFLFDLPFHFLCLFYVVFAQNNLFIKLRLSITKQSDYKSVFTRNTNLEKIKCGS